MTTTTQWLKPILSMKREISSPGFTADLSRRQNDTAAYTQAKGPFIQQVLVALAAGR
jgi:hypothetical protein